jgi:branched-chain amino acid transport system permease protein
MRVLNLVGIYCLLALGLNLVIGIAGQLSLGQPGFYAIGAYCAGILAVRFHVPFWVTLPAAAVAAGMVGLGIAPVLRVRGVFLAVATVAFAEIVRTVINNWLTVTNGPNGIPGIPFPVLGSFQFDSDYRYYWLVLACVVVCYVTIARIANSRIGRAMRALRDNEDAAEVLGVDVSRYKATAFAVAAAFAGLAGALFAHLQSYISPESFTFLTSIDIIVAVVIGGLGSVPGSVVGAFAAVVGPEVLRVVQNYRLIVYALVILGVLLFARGGLWGLIESCLQRVQRKPSDGADRVTVG